MREKIRGARERSYVSYIIHMQVLGQSLSFWQTQKGIHTGFHPCFYGQDTDNSDVSVYFMAPSHLRWHKCSLSLYLCDHGAAFDSWAVTVRWLRAMTSNKNSQLESNGSCSNIHVHTWHLCFWCGYLVEWKHVSMSYISSLSIVQEAEADTVTPKSFLKFHRHAKCYHQHANMTTLTC